MRTTVTLDPDVAAKLKAVARQRGISFKEALNSAVRAGLGRERRATRPFKVYAQSMGLRAGVNLDKALQLAAALEDAPAFAGPTLSSLVAPQRPSCARHPQTSR